MKPSVVHTSVMILSLVVILDCLAPAAWAAKCSTETVAGGWGFTLTGTIVTPSGGVPAAAIATATVDENGNLTKGTESRNVGGGYADETLTGKWSVNPDCTGTVYVQAYASGQLVRTSIVSVTFDYDSAEVRMVQKSLQLPDGSYVPVVITLEGRKQHSNN